MAAVLLVVGDSGSPTAGDTYLEGILEGMGYTVTMRSDETAEDTAGFIGVACAESCSAATLGTKYNAAAMGVVTHESAQVVNLRMTDVNGAANTTGTQVTVVDATNDIFDGPFGTFSGDLTIQASALLHYIDNATASFPAGVEIFAEWIAASNRKTVIAADSGAVLQTGNAEGKRAFLWPSNAAAIAGLTSDGENILKNAYFWAFGDPAAGDTGLAWIRA